MPVTTSPRIVALTEAGAQVSEGLDQLMNALRAAGAEVVLLAIPTEAPEPESVPTLGELKRGLGQFARGVVRTLRGDFDPTEANWLEAQLRAVEGRIDAWVTCDPGLAKAVFPLALALRPAAVRACVDGDYHLETAWREVDCDALVVVHPGLAAEVPAIRDGRARLFVGGALELRPAEPRTLDDKAMVVVSAARLDAGDIDPLLFQLSLAKPDTFSLLFLPSGRSGIDELIRTRAANYGLQGKRPKSDAPTGPWIRGAAVLVGHPSPAESILAVSEGVPQLYFAPDRHLNDGDRFVIARGAALHADLPITVAVHLESLMPNGIRRDEAVKAARELEPGDANAAAAAVLAAIVAGRPAAPIVVAAPAVTANSDLDDIGMSTAPLAPLASTDVLPMNLRRAYLKEIILRQGTLERQYARSQSGLETWQKRVRLARAAAQDDLADKAVPRVEGLIKLTDRLGRELKELIALRGRFAGAAELSRADREAVSRFMNADVAQSLERGEAPESAFTELEIADALEGIKRRLLKPGT